MMNVIAIFLGMSLSVGGVGGLLSGVCSKSLKRAFMWASAFGVADIVLLAALSPTSRFNPMLFLIAIIWAFIGWFLLGRFISIWRTRRRNKLASSATTE